MRTHIIQSLFSILQILAEIILNNMLTNVTKSLKIKQLFEFTCFIIHVDLECVGEKAYA